MFRSIRSGSRVRVRVAEVMIPNSQKIQPFWLLIDFDTCPFIRNVEEKIISILNSTKQARVSSSIRKRPTTTKESSRNQSHRRQYLQNENSESKIVDLDLYENTEWSRDNDLDLDLDLYPEENGGDSTEEAQIISCQLWMEGFLLLSEESSEIFRNGDLVSVKCLRYIVKESGTEVSNSNVNPDDISTKYSLKKRKLNHEHSIHSHQETSELNKMDDKVVKDNEVTIGSLNICKDNDYQRSQSQIFTENPVEKKVIKKQSRNIDSSVERKKSEDRIDNKGNGQQNIESSRAEDMKMQSNYCLDKRGDIESSIDDSDLISLMNERIKDLTEIHMNSKAIKGTEADSGLKEMKESDRSKRKRKRKRKKKVNGSNTDTFETPKHGEDSKKTRSHTFKFLAGHQPENSRLTFHSDSSSSDRETNIAVPNKDHLERSQKRILTSSPLPCQDKRNPKFRNDTVLKLSPKILTKQTPAVDEMSHRNEMDMTVSDKSSTLLFAEGQGVNPNSKFDELLQRRRVMGNNCSVRTLCNGGHVFTRDTQNPKIQYGLNSQLPKSNESSILLSEEIPQPLLESEVRSNGKESSSGSKTTISTSQMLLAPASDDMVELEVTPLYLDVAHCKSLIGAPQTGDIIAYKVLELSEDYTPNISDFKQGQIVSFDEGIVQIELFENSVPKKRLGRFELMFEDENEEKEDKNNNIVSVELHEMLDVRLVQRCQKKTE